MTINSNQHKCPTRYSKLHAQQYVKQGFIRSQFSIEATSPQQKKALRPTLPPSLSRCLPWYPPLPGDSDHPGNLVPPPSVVMMLIVITIIIIIVLITSVAAYPGTPDAAHER